MRLFFLSFGVGVSVFVVKWYAKVLTNLDSRRMNKQMKVHN